MNSRWMVVCVFLLIIPSFALAQRVTPKTKRLQLLLRKAVLVETNAQASQTVADVLAVTPVIPRGPMEVLQNYRDQMSAVSQTLSMELVAISQAVRSGQIMRADAEYLIQQRSQLALMQYEVFSALHDILAAELAQRAAAAAHREASLSSESGVVLVAPPWSRTSTNTPDN
jgi:BarA-like signal transduction histidine kinase